MHEQKEKPADGDGEVINSEEKENDRAGECLSQVNDRESEESCVSSVMNQSEADGLEVQSP